MCGVILEYSVLLMCEFYRLVAWVKNFPDKPSKIVILQYGFVIASHLHCMLILFISMIIKYVALSPTIWLSHIQ